MIATDAKEGQHHRGLRILSGSSVTSGDLSDRGLIPDASQLRKMCKGDSACQLPSELRPYCWNEDGTGAIRAAAPNVRKEVHKHAANETATWHHLNGSEAMEDVAGLLW